MADVLLPVRGGEPEPPPPPPHGLWGVTTHGVDTGVIANAASQLRALRARLQPRVLLAWRDAPLVDLAAFLAAPLAQARVGRLLTNGGRSAGIAMIDRDAMFTLLDDSAVPAADLVDVLLRSKRIETQAADFATTSADARPPAAFLDRDGVINVDVGYVYRPQDLVFTPTAAEGIRLLNHAGHRVLVVTNQSGVARGLYGTDDVERFHRHMQDELLRQGAHVDGFYYAPHHPEGSVAAFAIEHEDRKPKPGMLLRGMRDWSIRREGSFMIGDKESDVDAARHAGIPGVRVETNCCDLARTVRALLGS